MSQESENFEYNPGTVPNNRNRGTRLQNQVARISITFNQADNQIWLPNEFEAYHLVIRDRLIETFGVGCKFVFQLEKASTTGRLHYQCHLKFTHDKQRPLTVAEKIRAYMPGAHVTPDSKNGSTNAEFYCMKNDTRLDGPWGDDSFIIPDFTEFDAPLTGWLAQARDLMIGPIDPRHIIWIWEENGCSGKSHLATYLELKHKCIGLGLSRALDNFYAVSELPAIGYIFDIPRTLPQAFDWAEVYMSLEKIKDRNFLSTKYKPKKVLLPRIPHVLVLSNIPPKKEALSLDRWKVYKVTQNGQELTPDYTF